jgi:choline dehydrogenase-like flavoprotein
MLHDMLVVGAGPAGILVWERLTAAGLDAVLLEAGAKSAGKVPPPVDANAWAYRTHRSNPLEWLRTHAVGGRTLGWGGISFRFPDCVFKKGGWPYGARTLAPYYSQAESWLGVVEGRLHAHHRRAARQLGWRMVPLRGARRAGKIWTAADAAGACAARVGHVACAIDCEDRRAVSLRVRRADGNERRMRARSFVLAAGPVETTRLLLASGLGRVIPRLGQGLLRHPAVSYMLVEPHPAPAPQNQHELLDGALVPFPEHGFAIEVVGPLPMTDAMRIQLEKQGISVGEAARVTYVSAMSETEPNERCAVGLSRTGADALGRLLPVIRLSASKRDRELIAQMKTNCVAFAQAIARERAELFLLEDATSARHLFHEAGTCAMGAGAGSPCDPWGRLRAIDNIWVADASVFPSAGDRHPTLTVLAHALRVARSVQRRLAA